VTAGARVGFGFASLGGAALVALACSDDPHLRTSPEQAAGGGGPCAAKAGELPAPDCDDGANTCESTPGCVIDEARCGSTATCLPIGDNKGKDILDLRIRRLKITTPAALAGEFIQKNIVTLNIDLAEPTCGEPGKGLFSWLLQIDRKTNTLITGGAPPASDPIGKGFCFARFATVGANPVQVAPITSKIAFSGETFRTLEPQKVKIPIFTTPNVASVILLPITDVQVSGATLSADGNCIGKLNPLALSPACTSSDATCSKWKTAGAIGGFITLEEADAVKIELLGKSLCAFFSGDTVQCARDGAGKIVYRADFCSTDKQAGSCRDSVWLSATFAASAAKIFEGKGTVAGCSGAPPVDGGLDAAGDGSADAADGD
jgi:hypothetical protein